MINHIKAIREARELDQRIAREESKTNSPTTWHSPPDPKPWILCS